MGGTVAKVVKNVADLPGDAADAILGGDDSSAPAPAPAVTGPSQEEFDQLQADFNKLQGQYTGLQDQYSGLETNYDTLSTDFSGLRTDYDDLYNMYGTAQAINDQYGNQLVRNLAQEQGLAGYYNPVAQSGYTANVPGSAEYATPGVPQQQPMGTPTVGPSDFLYKALMKQNKIATPTNPLAAGIATLAGSGLAKPQG